MPCPNKITLKSYLTPEEYAEVLNRADQARLSVSKYVKAVCLGYEPKSKVDQEALLAMLQVNSDLSRLGNLLKLALDQSNVNEDKVARLIDSIQQTRDHLNDKVKAI